MHPLGERRERRADRYPKPLEEMFRLFARYPQALARTAKIVDRCRFSLDESASQYLEERADPSLIPQETFETLTWEGSAWRYPRGFRRRAPKKFRRVVMRANIIAVRGRVRREGHMDHLVARRLVDLSVELATIGSRDAAFPLSHDAAIKSHTPAAAGPREHPPKGLRTRGIYGPDLQVDIINAKGRNFH